MQRSRGNLYLIVDFALSFGVAFYLLLSVMYRGLPPLLGFFFVTLVVLKFEHENKFKKYNFAYYFAIFYLFCAEQIYGFNLFSIALAYIIFYTFIYEFSLRNIKFRNFLLGFYVVIAYALILGVNGAISYIKKADAMSVGSEYLSYIVVDILLSLLFFKGRFV
ncbi:MULTISPECIES: hypothetical protein [unclassified Campylobacter]|uniref:hypothetical protein n=1 Tax=unclassified Campylobacter TaxID=2593542 RepID=UPI0022E9A6F9|nr:MULTISPECIES: hypothetical protein [unclassified Campylobacter]MDA3047687.1 hypothetical protein [Campylobacter sp. JMF_08 NE1]MDA3054168.1 hypothetical protein [Campylobacter sp. VBCF_07 NA4]MDA3060859.1 hypothetical protein [Campylobacter sp. VBCF_02 NA5]MDA3070372.1 hypothetical protein [Campylobacter sp. VBCF_08 NA3]WBR53683.1 hypothetical protein PF027_04955 [Campylobacter sp. VBCF_01 NA2]